MLSQKVNSDSMKEMKNMNIAIYEDELRELRSKGLVDLLFVLASIFSGAVCMVFIEKWNFLDSFYWACVTVRPPPSLSPSSSCSCLTLF